MEDEEALASAALTRDKRRSRSGWRWEEHKERKDRLRDRVQLSAVPKPRSQVKGVLSIKDPRLNRKMALGPSVRGTLQDIF